MSTPAHTTLSVKQFLTQNGMTLLPHPPCSPDLSQSNFLLFPQMKKMLKGKRFANLEEVKQKMAETLKGIKISEFKNCVEQWKKCLDRCIVSNGEYSEGERSLNV